MSVVSLIKSFPSRQKVTYYFMRRLKRSRAFCNYSLRLQQMRMLLEVLLDGGYYRNRGWQKNERREVERREEINSRTHRGAEIGPQSLHGLQTIAVGIASLCTLFLPSVLLFYTFSGSFLRSFPPSSFFPLLSF